MFTPQKELQLRGSEAGQKDDSISGAELAFDTNSRSPRRAADTLTGRKARGVVENDGNMDQDVLFQKVSKLEGELYEYQYNMGLLLIEKKEWDVKYEELKRVSTEVADTLAREQAAHSTAISEAEKRDESLKKALGVERQCVQDLEKALRELRTEYAEIKFNTDSRVAEANALVASAEAKSLEVGAEVRATDAKHAEVIRKSAEVERKLHELEARENTLRRERFFFSAENEAREITFSKQMEDMREWEQKLKSGEEKLAVARLLLNQREERANENDKNIKKRQNALEELQKRIQTDSTTVKSKEDDIRSRITSLAIKEKAADDIRNSLEIKEKNLIEWEAKLNDKKELEIQKQLDEHAINLDRKKKEFEIEMNQKRKFHDELLKNSVVEVEKKEAGINHLEEALTKRDQTLEKKLEKMREKEIDLDSKSEALKEREKSLKIEETSLKRDRKQIHSEEEDLLKLKAELENLRVGIEKQQLILKESNEQLKVTEDERSEHKHLQSELKQEMNKWRMQNEELLKKASELRQEKEKFEKEWEKLDDYRDEVKKELDSLLEQKKHFEKVKQSEEQRLNEEKQEIKHVLERELESLKVEKDSFDARMEHEKSILFENYNYDKRQLMHDIEMRKQELETELLRRQEEMEFHLQEKEKSFEAEKEVGINNISYLREVARRETEEMKLERSVIDEEKKEISRNKEHVESQQCEMKKDISKLISLSQKLKDQREQFVKERECFITFLEKQKNCTTCGENVSEYMLSGLHPLSELENLELPPLSRATEHYMTEADECTPVHFGNDKLAVNSSSPPGGTVSWLRKCTSKIFKFSAVKKLEIASAIDTTAAAANLGRQLDTELQKTSPDRTNEPEFGQTDSDIKDFEANQNKSSNDSQNFDIEDHSRKPSKGARPSFVRPRSMNAALASAEAILGTSVEENAVHCSNCSAENSSFLNEEVESELAKNPQNKRRRDDMPVSLKTSNNSYSEGHSNGAHRNKKKKPAASEQVIIENRYNLRRSKVLGSTTGNGSLRESRRRKRATTIVNGKGDRLPGLIVESSGGSKEEIHEPGTSSHTRSGGFQGTDNKPLRSTNAASEFSADSPANFQIVGSNLSGKKNTVENFADDMDLTEEVNVTAETPSRGEGDDGEDVNNLSQHEVSVGKKLWNFLTT